MAIYARTLTLALLMLSAPLLLASAATRGQLADLFVDDAGRVALLWVDADAVVLERLPAGTRALPETLGDTTRLQRAGRRPAVGVFWGPRVVRHAEQITVAAIFAEKRGQDGDVFVWQSVDGGESFAEPRRLQREIGAAAEGFLDLAVSANGRVAVCWLHSSESRVSVRGARTREDALDWSDDDEWAASSEGSICECCPPALAFDDPDDALWLVFRDSADGFRDMQLARVGARPLAPMQLGDERWRLAACPMSEADLILDARGPRAIYRREATLFLTTPGVEPGAAPSVSARVDGKRPQLARLAQGLALAWLDRGDLLLERPAALLPERVAQGVLRHRMASAPDGRGPLLMAYDAGEHGAPALHLVELSPRVD